MSPTVCTGQLCGGGDSDARLSTVARSSTTYDQPGPDSQSVLGHAASAATSQRFLSLGGVESGVNVALADRPRH